jgi:archaellum component FlaC
MLNYVRRHGDVQAAAGAQSLRATMAAETPLAQASIGVSQVESAVDLGPIKEALAELTGQVASVRGGLQVIDDKVAGVQTQVAGVQTQVAGVQTQVAGVQAQVNEVKSCSQIDASALKVEQDQQKSLLADIVGQVAGLKTSVEPIGKTE